MANPQPYYWGYSGDPLIDETTNGFVWRLGADKTIDWSIAGGFEGEFWLNPAATQSQLAALLTVYSYYADVKFNFVGYFLTPAAAYSGGSDITFSLSETGALFHGSQTWAQGFFPTPTSTGYAGIQGDVFLNVSSQANFLTSYAPGSAGWFVFMHEVGHALGLKHPHDDGGTGRPTLQQLGLSQFDTDWTTVMSYQDDYNWNLVSWDPATPMIFDVLALQYLYGPNLQTNLGDTVYPLSRTGYYTTVWDAGGTDTVDASASAEGWLIVLPNYHLTSVVNTPVGFTAPVADSLLTSPTTFEWLTGTIENARGSSAADFILGSDGPNRLDGGAGNDSINGGLGDDTLIGGLGDDTIDGGGGYDIAYLSGTAGSYRTSVIGATRTMQGQDGTDTYMNVFRFHFDDVSVAYDITGNAGKAYRLYKAAFNRSPDFGGMGYQMHALDSGLMLSQVAGNFIASPEFQSKYGNVDNTQFITLLYQNVLSRAPDSDGLQFHLKELQVWGLTRADVLTNFSESPENQANVIGAIQNGIVYT